MLTDNSGNRTRLQPGDVMIMDIDTLAQLIADVSGLSFEELKGEEYPTFRFSFNS